MIHKLLLTALITLSATLTTQAQTEKTYELEREMPVFLNQLKQELTYPLSWQSTAGKKMGKASDRQFNKWRQKARAKVYECMQAPPPKAKAWDTEILAEEQRDGYKARKIRFNLTAYSRVTAYMLIPDSPTPGTPVSKPGKHPAVILLHDHGAHFTIGKEKMIRPFQVPDETLHDADKWVEGGYDGQYFGDYLAQNGYVVIAIDALYWGERSRKEGYDGNKYSMVAGHFQMLGRSLSGFMNYEDVYTADFLAQQPEVDPDRIGCTGWSIGAYRAWMLSALTDKVKATVAVCWMNTTDSQFSWEHGRENGGWANTLPGLRQWLDYPHIASIACPKPTYFISGRKDKLFHPTGVQEAFSQMQQVWQSRKAADRFKAELWDMPHHCGKPVQKAALDFFRQWL